MGVWWIGVSICCLVPAARAAPSPAGADALARGAKQLEEASPSDAHALYKEALDMYEVDGKEGQVRSGRGPARRGPRHRQRILHGCGGLPSSGPLFRRSLQWMSATCHGLCVLR
jgi:hypothetical protein